MKNTPPRSPAGSFSCCLGLILNVFSIAQTLNTEWVFNLKCVPDKILGGRKAPSSSCHVFYVYIHQCLQGRAFSVCACLGQC